MELKKLHLPFSVIFDYYVSIDNIIKELWSALNAGQLNPELKGIFLLRVSSLYDNIKDLDSFDQEEVNSFDITRCNEYTRFCMLYRTKEILAKK